MIRNVSVVASLVVGEEVLRPGLGCGRGSVDLVEVVVDGGVVCDVVNFFCRLDVDAHT